VKIAKLVKIMDEMEYRNAVQSVLSNVGKLEWNRLGANIGDRRADAFATLKVGSKKKRILLEFRSTGEPRAIAEFAGRLGIKPRDDIYPVMVAPFISDRGRELCERSNVGCIDLSGNAFLKFDSVYINNRGNNNRYKVERKQRNLLSKKSSWVIRAMLGNPNKEWTMQDLSKLSSVSIAQVYKVWESLEADGFIEKRRGSTRLSDASGLLDLLANSYRFSEQAIVGYYSPLKSYDQIFSRLRQLNGCEYALTMGAAAQLILPTVRSTDVNMYVRDCDAVQNALDLEPVEFGGNIYLIEPKDEGVLKNAQLIEGIRVVSNLQLYLDLYNYPQRGREQADAIREKMLGV